MNIMKICKGFEQITSEFQTLLASGANEIDDKTAGFNGDTIYLCTPCFVDADRLYPITFDKIYLLIPPEEIDEFDAKWIAELMGNYREP